ncbi:MAG: hypothetical protein R2726_08880 [Acidimicrobiales bacterium]
MGLDDVRRRLAHDPAFADQVIVDPRRTLEPYDLGVDELRVLIDQLNDDPDLGPVEQRRRRARFFGLLAERRTDGHEA